MVKPRGDFKYDVAVSFAGEDRETAEAVAAALKSAGARVFYDRDQQSDMWGEDLIEFFDQIYRVDSRFALLFVSRFYAQKMWTRHERRSALARGLAQDEVYVLPVRLDDCDLPGLRPTVGYLDFRHVDVAGVAEAVLTKLGQRPQPTELSAVSRAPRNQVEEERLLQGRQAGWEYLYFSSRLMAGVAALESKYLDHETGNASPSGDVVDAGMASEYMRRATDDAQRLTDSLMRLMEPATQERAFGAPGVSGDPDRIAHLARRWTSAYEGFLDWAARLIGTSVPNRYRQAFLLLAAMVNEPIEQYRAFVRQLAAECDAIPQAVAEQRPLEIRLTLTLAISDEVSARYSRELERIRRGRR